MKQLIFIIIFMFIGIAYAQEIVNTVTVTEIITKGKIIKGASYDSPLVVMYKKEIYACSITFREMMCTRPADRGVSTDL